MERDIPGYPADLYSADVKQTQISFERTDSLGTQAYGEIDRLTGQLTARYRYESSHSFPEPIIAMCAPAKNG